MRGRFRAAIGGRRWLLGLVLSAAVLPPASGVEFEGALGTLGLGGFMAVDADSGDPTTDGLAWGDPELDLEYGYGEHFAASAALLWSEHRPQVAVALLDYHLFDDRVPARGRILQEPGLHLQGGRFDLPFAVDYQYFAPPDRPNISAPFTTERIQQGGFNGDGVRGYGSWHNVDLSLYWTGAMYAEHGDAIGGRVAYAFGRNPYRFHQSSGLPRLDLGFSYQVDRLRGGELGDRVYGLDLGLRYGIWELIGEALWHQAHETQVDADGVDLGKPDEHAFHLSLVADLQDALGLPLSAFGRYEQWRPGYQLLLDPEDDTQTYRVRSLPRVTVGLRYDLGEHVVVKLEYADTLGRATEEPDFVGRAARVQLVARF
jgi:hypothetical protein